MIDRAIINRDMWAFTYLAAVSCLNVHMLPITLKENVNIKIKSSTESLFSKIRPCAVLCCAAEVWYHFSASIYQDYIASPVGSFLWIGLKWDEIHHKTLFLHAKSSRKPVKCEETHTHTHCPPMCKGFIWNPAGSMCYREITCHVLQMVSSGSETNSARQLHFAKMCKQQSLWSLSMWLNGINNMSERHRHGAALKIPF